jgi:hypothetical protein
MEFIIIIIIIIIIVLNNYRPANGAGKSNNAINSQYGHVRSAESPGN